MCVTPRYTSHLCFSDKIKKFYALLSLWLLQILSTSEDTLRYFEAPVIGVTEHAVAAEYP